MANRFHIAKHRANHKANCERVFMSGFNKFNRAEMHYVDVLGLWRKVHNGHLSVNGFRRILHCIHQRLTTKDT